MSKSIGRLSGIVFLCNLMALIWLMHGCQTYTPQVIKYCGTYHLYTNKAKLDAVYANVGGEKDSVGGFYTDDHIHVMKWDFETMGHEVYHGLRRKGLIIENGFGHWK